MLFGNVNDSQRPAYPRSLTGEGRCPAQGPRQAIFPVALDTLGGPTARMELYKHQAAFRIGRSFYLLFCIEVSPPPPAPRSIVLSVLQ